MSGQQPAITIHTPATSANLGPGFDTFGIALNRHNRFHFTPSERNSLSLSSHSTVPTQALTTDNPNSNLIFQAIEAFNQHHKPAETPYFHVDIEVHIPLARGLGSSSTAIAAGLFAANTYAGNPLTTEELVTLGTNLEGHPDNIAPALLGGALLCDPSSNNSLYHLPWPADWQFTLVIPEYELLTQTARDVMPAHYTLHNAIFNVRKSSVLTYAILKQDAAALQNALHDELHQPYRSQLIPEFQPISELAKQAGALGTVISGAGSTIAIIHTPDVQNTLHTTLEAFQAEHPQTTLTLQSAQIDTRGTYA